MRMKEYLSMIRAVIQAMRNPPETVRYPFGLLNLPEGFRGAIIFDPQNCSGCGLCVRDCPADGLELIKRSRQEYKLLHYPARCAYCGQCEDSCVRGAISHSNEMVDSTTDPRGWVVVLIDKTQQSIFEE